MSSAQLVVMSQVTCHGPWTTKNVILMLLKSLSLLWEKSIQQNKTVEKNFKKFKKSYTDSRELESFLPILLKKKKKSIFWVKFH